MAFPRSDISGECARPSLAKEGTDAVVEDGIGRPVGTLRVISPARPRLVASRKRVLRGHGRPWLRSVDSECAGRVIEPRKGNLGGGRRFSLSGRQYQSAVTTWRRSTPGSKSRARTRGDCQEPGRSSRLLEEIPGALGEPGDTSPQARGCYVWRPKGANERTMQRYRRAKETK